jgi:tryptophan halogenase
MKHTIVVVGKGTSGAIVATYIKTYWIDFVDVIIVHDSKQKTIGVGESLTPNIYSYLNYVGITRDELIKNVNATIKLGLKFQNWNGDGKGYYHSFYQLTENMGYYNYNNFLAAYEIISNKFNNQLLYGDYCFDNNLIPPNEKFNQSLHIDATLMSEYILKKFENKINIIDGKIIEIIKKENEHIDYLVLEDGRKIYGDFFIDASGFNSILFKSFNRQWVDKTDWMPLDSCIPNPMEYNHEEINPYTTAEASSEGWILQVPLQNRWGTGYLYSESFTSDEKAFDNFELFLKAKYKKTLTNTSKIIRFKSGYWSEQWIGNCLSVGLSSGFAEPLEATNIHQTIDQIIKFVSMYNFKIFDFDKKRYNEYIISFYNRVYDYIRFCYTGNRTDSDFWKYMNNNIPERIKSIEEKVSHSLLNSFSFENNIFNYDNFTVVANGLKKIKKEMYLDEVINRSILETSKNSYSKVKEEKDKINKLFVSHIDYIKKITCSI